MPVTTEKGTLHAEHIGMEGTCLPLPAADAYLVQNVLNDETPPAETLVKAMRRRAARKVIRVS